MGKADIDEERTARMVVLLGRHFSSRTATRSPAAESHLSLRKSSVPSGNLAPSILRGLKRGRKLASVCRTSTPLRDRAGADDA